MSDGTGAGSHVVAISAHKGGSENSQSETLQAYAHATDTGAEYVEFDIRPTGDGELIVFHDSHLRQGDAVAATSYARICALAGFEVPRVADVMRLIAGKAIGHLDLKAIGGEEEVVEMALDIMGPGKFVVTSLEDESVAAIKARFPDVPAALSLGRDLRTVPRSKWAQIRLSELFPMRRIRACNADWAAVNRQLAAAGVLAQCHRNGITTMIWTVNQDKEIMRWLADSRVAVLITDRPAHAVALRAALGSGEAMVQPGEGRPHHLLSRATTRSAFAEEAPRNRLAVVNKLHCLSIPAYPRNLSTSTTGQLRRCSGTFLACSVRSFLGNFASGLTALGQGSYRALIWLFALLTYVTLVHPLARTGQCCCNRPRRMRGRSSQSGPSWFDAGARSPAGFGHGRVSGAALPGRDRVPRRWAA